MPLITTGYDNVVVLDSQVVLEGRPLDQLPWQELFQGSILLLVPRQVQSEIDKRKNDSRLGKRARAFNRLLDHFILERTPSSVVSRPRVDVATISNRSIDWDALDDLDRDDGDDRIVAQTLNAIVDDPTRIVLLSHDMRPRDAAATHGLSALKLPESWLREPEPSPAQQRIAELEAKNRLLNQDQPQLEVTIEMVTPSPWFFREVGEASGDQITEMLNRRLRSVPRQASRGPFDIGIGTYDDTHPGRVRKWSKLLAEDIPLIHQGLAKIFSQHRCCVTVRNVGQISAEGLSLEIRSGNTVLHSKPFLVMLDGSSAPHPRPFHLQIAHQSLRDIVPARREPFEFYWDKSKPGNSLILSCASFRQERSHSIEISIELLSGSFPKAHVEAVVTASNMKGDARARLVSEIEHVESNFDEVYDTVEQSIRIDPPYELANISRDRDVTWYRNCGLEYERD